MNLPYLPWSDPIFLFKQSVKIREIVKSTLFSNFQDGIGGGSQQLVSHGQPIVVEVVDKTCFHMSFEKLHKVRSTIVTQLGHGFNGNRVTVVVLYILDDELQFFQRFFF